MLAKFAKSIGRTVAVAVVGFSVAGSGYAGILDGNASALPGFTGTAAYDNTGGLNGTIDYAVFTTADFVSVFGSPAGITLTPGYAVYAYQVLNAGTDFVSQEIVATPNNSAVDIGSFENLAGEIAPDGAFLSPTTARWTFGNPSIQGGEDSYILVFSSPNLPTFGGSITVNGGGTAFTNVPTPSNIPLPEPATAALLGLGGLAMLRRR